ncbi:FKBP-type peptidyl-prolyl cis-trans isomerase [Actinokineospora diospyrosa]|uniref:Peptidyl-prolyl cis-trans isomerase n=1 Tax=Actinokineospora diospyrosa TaxID=103728 RepID=A0ABT1I702_9PSEU|nr:FKBP-type peptidyl-prolyl cis-trans isomerase [Actinokineospora diospyrosa]MCP2268405.1 peptidylprolyl isomerase [Actinokineospora diospyrosa]
MRNVGKFMIAVAVGVSLTACANSEQASTQGPGDATVSAKARPTSSSAAPTTTVAPSATQPQGGGGQECSVDDVLVEGAAGSKPKITIPPACGAPKGLQSKDLIEGTGPDVKAGVTLDTHYVLVAWSDKQQKDSSWDRGEPYPLENVGKAQVIDGWNEGLLGMKQGGRRLLIVPPEKGYGAQGNSGIVPNETLVFVIDAVKVS